MSVFLASSVAVVGLPDEVVMGGLLHLLLPLLRALCSRPDDADYSK